MKKLLCVLMFGMVFGQAELTTRVYEIDISLSENETQDFSLSGITNGDIDDYQNAILEMFNATDISLDSNYTNLRIQYPWTEHNFANFYTNGGDDYNTPYYYPPTFLNYFGGSQHKWFNKYGNLSATIQIAITAEFPEEDTGYIEEGFDYCIDVGANLVASPCEQSVPILDTLPSEIADNLTGIIGQGVATTNLNGNWVGSLNGLGGGNGYWFQSNVNACFNYNCAEN